MSKTQPYTRVYGNPTYLWNSLTWNDGMLPWLTLDNETKTFTTSESWGLSLSGLESKVLQIWCVMDVEGRMYFYTPRDDPWAQRSALDRRLHIRSGTFLRAIHALCTLILVPSTLKVGESLLYWLGPSSGNFGHSRNAQSNYLRKWGCNGFPQCWKAGEF